MDHIRQITFHADNTKYIALARHTVAQRESQEQIFISICKSEGHLLDDEYNPEAAQWWL